MKNILTIIPAAGRGSRMLSLTDNCAKSMMSVAGKPLISYLLDQIVEAELYNVAIIVGYQKESLIDYVNTFYHNKLNITFIEQKELLGLGHAIYQVTKQMDLSIYTDGVFIMLGDAIFNTNKIFNFKESYIACEEMVDYSRWCIAVQKDNKLVKLLDKPTNKPEINLALVGAYYFDDSKLFIESVQTAINSGITIKNEYQISTAIEIYKDTKPISIITVEEDEWFDFGELGVYNTNRRKFNQSRFFNNIIYNENSSITKKSDLNKTKIQKEINWFLALPEALKLYIPSLISYNLDDTDTSYTVEYCVGNTLQEMWLYNNLDTETWVTILTNILNIVNTFRENSSDYKIDFYSFIESQLNKRVNLSDYFDGEYDINGVHYNLSDLYIFFTSYLEDFKSRSINTRSHICHGDMVFSNIIYDPSNSSVKLIDPRGDFCGNIIYGDSRYDIAKLAQCIIGDYDYIVNDLFVLTKDGYKLYTNKTDEFKKTLFDVVTNNFNKKDIIFLTAIQFMTMIPLHAENKKHQTVMKYKSIELLSKLKQLTEDKL